MEEYPDDMWSTMSARCTPWIDVEDQKVTTAPATALGSGGASQVQRQVDPWDHDQLGPGHTTSSGDMWTFTREDHLVAMATDCSLRSRKVDDT